MVSLLPALSMDSLRQALAKGLRSEHGAGPETSVAAVHRLPVGLAEEGAA